jgi:hypothetical protein
VISSLLLALALAVTPPAPAVGATVPGFDPVQAPLAGGPPLTPEDEAAVDALASWIDDPVKFVRDNFAAEPDAWQVTALEAVARSPRVALNACKGPGKSCGEAWAILWFLATRVDAQVICTSITADNLRDGLWKELALWHSKSPFLQRCFDVRGERIVSRERPKTWWVSARSWSQSADPTKQASTLAGFHGRHILIVLDEVGSYPEGVFAAAEAIFANEHCDEAKLLVGGNPESVDGPLYRIASKDRARWVVIHVTGDPDDPKRSPRISIVWAQQQIDDWGRDNDWVRVNVLGLFPKVSSDKLLGPDDITLAEKRTVSDADYLCEPIIFGLDVARFGSDRSVLYKRQGPVLFTPDVWRGLDGNQLGDRVAVILGRQSRRPDAVFVDAGGPGASAVDRLRHLGWGDILLPIDFGGSALDTKFANLKAEMAWKAADWVKKLGCLPQGDGELASELCAPKIRFKTVGKRTVFVLESKEELKARGVPSPDKADALGLTFAAPVAPLSAAERQARALGIDTNKVLSDFDPLGGSNG